MGAHQVSTTEHFKLSLYGCTSGQYRLLKGFLHVFALHNNKNSKRKKNPTIKIIINHNHNHNIEINNSCDNDADNNNNIINNEQLFTDTEVNNTLAYTNQ